MVTNHGTNLGRKKARRSFWWCSAALLPAGVFPPGNQDKQVFQDHTALSDTPWRTREFAFYDLDGNGLTFYRNL
jgi:hypothetical protein